jgi:hypothetical protein
MIAIWMPCKIIFVRKINLFVFVQFSSPLLFDWYVAVCIQPKKEKKDLLSRHDTTVCSLMYGPIAIVGTVTHIEHEYKWLYIGHSK